MHQRPRTTRTAGRRSSGMQGPLATARRLGLALLVLLPLLTIVTLGATPTPPAGATTPQYGVMATTATTAGTIGVAVDPFGNFYYSVSNTSSTLTVLATGTQQIVAQVPLGASGAEANGLTGMVIDPQGRYLYLTGYSPGNHSYIDVVTLHADPTLDTVTGPSGMVTPWVNYADPTINAAGTELYVSAFGIAQNAQNRIVGFNLATQAMNYSAYPAAPYAPNGHLAVSPTSSALYYSYATGIGELDVNAPSSPPTTFANPSAFPFDLAVNPAGTKLYALEQATSTGTHQMDVFTLGATPTLATSVAVNNSSTRITIDATGIDAIVISQSSPPVVQFVNLASLAVTSTTLGVANSVTNQPQQAVVGINLVYVAAAGYLGAAGSVSILYVAGLRGTLPGASNRSDRSRAVACQCDSPSQAQAHHGDPVNSANGDFSQSATDLNIPGPGVPLAYTRTYDATAAQDEAATAASSPALGYGWSTPFDMTLAASPTTVASTGPITPVPTTATVTEENGAQTTFAPYVAGTSPSWCTGTTDFCATSPLVQATLHENADGTWRYTRTLHTTAGFTFAVANATTGIAALTAKSDAAGNTLTATTYVPGTSQPACPTGSTCAAWTSSASGQSLVIATGATTHTVTQVFNPASGQTATYAYTGPGCATWTGTPGDLCSVTDPAGVVSSFSYDTAQATPYNYDLTAFTPPGAAAHTTNAYNASGQVAAQTDPTGNVTGFAYATGGTTPGADETTTITTSPQGTGGPTRTVTDQYAAGVLVSEDTGAATAVYTRDPATLLPMSVTVTPDAGHTGTARTTTYTRDTRGNTLTTTDPVGNVTTHAYTANGLAWCTISPAEHLVGAACPATAPTTAPAAGTTPWAGVTVAVYNAANQVIATTTPTGATSITAFTQAGDGVPVGLPYCSVDPGNYAAGVTCPRYATAIATPPLGATVTAYNALGLPATTHAPSGTTAPATATTAYDTSDRVAAVTDALGAVTRTTYTPDDQVLQVTVSTSASAPTPFSTTKTAYDSSGRQYCAISALQFAQGTTTCPSVAGDPAASPSPSVTSTYYDAAGRIVQTTAPVTGTNPHGATSLAAYDGTGARYCAISATAYAAGTTACPAVSFTTPTPTSDAYLGTALTTFNAQGLATQVTSPVGGVTTTAYDGFGEPTTTTVSSSSAASPPVTTTNAYDADGHVVATTVGSTVGHTETTTTAYDPNGHSYCSISPKANAAGGAVCPAWQAAWITAPPTPATLAGTPGGAPLAPVATVTTTTGATLTWAAIPGATGYTLSANGAALSGATNTPATSYTDTTEAPGTSVAYTLVVTTASGASTPSPATAVVTTPTTPTGSITGTTATLTWTGPTTGITWSLSDNGVLLTTGVTLSGTGTAPLATVTGLAAGSTNSFTVTGAHASPSATSPASAPLVLTALAATPAGLAAPAVSCTTVTLTWSAAPGATGYRVYANGTAVWSGATTYVRLTTAPSATTLWTVSATNAGGESAPSTALSVTTPAAAVPAAPTGLVATAITATGATLTWAATPGATSYSLYANGTLLASVPENLANPTVPTYTATDTSAAPGTYVAYSVTATSNQGTGVASAVTPVVTTPTGLSEVTATETTTSAQLTWTGQATGLTWGVSENGVLLTTGVTLSGTGTAPIATVTGLVAGTTYSFTVAGTHASPSATSPASAATAAGPLTTAPRSLSVTTPTAGGATLTWTAPTSGAPYGYEIWAYTAASGWYQTDGWGAVMTTSYVDVNETPGTYTQWRVSADNANYDSSAFSAVPTGQMLPPTAPTLVSATATTQVITWQGQATGATWALKRNGVAYSTGVTFSTSTNGGTTPLQPIATITGLTGNTNYAWTVSGTNTSPAKVSAYSATGNLPTFPTAVTGITGVPGPHTITLNWTPTPDATDYLVTVNGTWQFHTYSAAPTYTQTGLASGYPDYFTVTGINAAGTAPASASVGPWLPLVLGIPAAPTASAVTSSSATLSWTTVPGATGYTLSQNGTVVYTGPATTAPVTGLAFASAIPFTVAATDSGGTAPASPATTVTTAALSQSAPVVTAPTTTGATVTWPAVPGATSYTLVANGTALPGATNTTATTYTDTTEAPGTYVSYAVTATDPATTSAGSAPAQVVTTPAGLAVTAATPTAVTVAWTGQTSGINWNVYANGTLVTTGVAIGGSGTTPTATLTGLTPATASSITVNGIHQVPTPTSSAPSSALVATTALTAGVPGLVTGASTSFATDTGVVVQTANPDGATTVSAVDVLGRAYCTSAPLDTAAYLAAHVGATYPYACPTSAPTVAPTGTTGTTTTLWDRAGHVVSTTNGVGSTTTATYDSAGDQLTSTDALGHTTTTCAYAQAGTGACPALLAGFTGLPGQVYASITPATQASPSGIVTVTGYLPGGGVAVSALDRAGTAVNVATPAYDALGEVTGTTYSATDTAHGYTTPAATTATYNADGSRHSLTDATGTTTTSYDLAGHVTQSAVAATGAGLTSKTTNYTYFTSGVLQGLTYPAMGATTPSVAYTYDDTGMLATEQIGTATPITVAHDADGNATAVTDPNGTTLTRTFNLGDAQTNLTLAPTATPSAVTVGYATPRTAGEQVATEADTGAGTAATQTYGYTAAIQVGSVNGAAATYDAANQVIQTTPTSSYQCYSAAGELTTTTVTPCATPTATAALTYNTEGDRTAKTPTTGTATTTAFDAAGQLTATTTGGATTTYAYNGAGLRLGSTTGGATTTYAYDTTSATPQLLENTTGTSGTIGTAYVYGPGGVLAQVDASGTVTYDVTDQLGSLRAQVNAAGTTVATANYDAWGNPTVHTGTATGLLGYAGAVTDATGTLYLVHRYYDPATAQFLSRDPLVAQTGTPYAYTANDPLNATDPSGLSGGAVVPGCVSSGCAHSQSTSATGNPWDNLGLNSTNWLSGGKAILNIGASIVNTVTNAAVDGMRKTVGGPFAGFLPGSSQFPWQVPYFSNCEGTLGISTHMGPVAIAAIGLGAGAGAEALQQGEIAAADGGATAAVLPWHDPAWLTELAAKSPAQIETAWEALLGQMSEYDSTGDFIEFHYGPSSAEAGVAHAAGGFQPIVPEGSASYQVTTDFNAAWLNTEGLTPVFSYRIPWSALHALQDLAGTLGQSTSTLDMWTWDNGQSVLNLWTQEQIDLFNVYQVSPGGPTPLR